MTATQEEKITRLLLVAGLGELPIELTKSAQAQGVEVIVFALDKRTYNEMKDITETYLFSPVEAFKMADKGMELGIKHVTFIGKVPKSSFFKNLHKLEPRMLKEIQSLVNMNDDSFHLKLVDKIENSFGAKIIPQTLYLKHYFPKAQSFTKRLASNEELEEAKYGLEMAKGIAALDIGQTVIVKNKAVIAVEAIEGTNKCIKRAKASMGLGLFEKRKAISVCKVAKPEQDQRFDIPTVGLQTIEAMPKGSKLFFEASETFFVNQDQAIELADRKNILIQAIDLD